MLAYLEEKTVLLALRGVGDLPLRSAEAGVPAVVVALLVYEGVTAAVRDLAQYALLHTLGRGAGYGAAGGPGLAAAVQLAGALEEGEIFTMCEGVTNILAKTWSLYLINKNIFK